MPGWDGSTRKSRLPPNWFKLRIVRLRMDSPTGSSKDAQCQHVRYDTGKKCLAPANQVDHKIPGDDHSIGNLQSLCEWHHNGKSSREGGIANGAKKKPKQQSLGLIYGD